MNGQEEEISLKINVTGGGGCGKTRLVITAGEIARQKGWQVDNLTGWSEELVSTVGGHFVNFGAPMGENGKRYSYSVWDLGGQVRYADVRKVYLEGTDGLICVTDVSRRYTLDILENAMLAKEVRTVCEENIPIMLVGNKKDLRETLLDSNTLSQLADALYERFQSIINDTYVEYSIYVKIGQKKGQQTIRSNVLPLGDKPALRVADFEAGVFDVLQTIEAPGFTEMNLKLLAREIWFRLTDKLFSELSGDKIPYSLLERASLGAPLFKEFTKDPDVLIPIEWSKDDLRDIISSTSVSTEELHAFSSRLQKEGFNVRHTIESSAISQENVSETFERLFQESLEHHKPAETTDKATAKTQWDEL
jgi:small GTP-binding protein